MHFIHASTVARLAWRGAHIEYPATGVRQWARRLKFMGCVLRHASHLRNWLNLDRPSISLLSLQERPQAVGVAMWPYLHSGWSASQRFAAIRAHYQELANAPCLRLGVQDTVVLADLTVMPDLRVIMDRPLWFLREGEVCISLVLGQERIYTIAFTLGRWQGGLAAYIGAIQGRDGQSIQEIDVLYKELTKKFHGMRPRDFLIVFMQLVCEAAGIEHLLAVSDPYRHHRHPFFADKAKNTQCADYDAIWRDRGGELDAASGFFVLPARWMARPAQDIPTQKRALYRRRYELVLQLKTHLAEWVAKAGPACVREACAPRLAASMPYQLACECTPRA